MLDYFSEIAIIKYAYIDPGTGSLIGTTLIGLGVSLLFTLRGWFYKILTILWGRKDALDCNFQDQLVFFNEGKIYWSSFKPILEELEKMGRDFVYLSADSNDPAFKELAEYKHATLVNLKSIQGAIYSLNKLRAKMCVMTTPQLDIMALKRSKGVVHYCHLPHSVSDFHTYKKFALDHYDSVLCVNKYHINSTRALEEKRKRNEKLLLETGCTYYQNSSVRNKTEDKNILNKKQTLCIAPTWGEKSILGDLDFIIEVCLTLDYHLVLRPHPQSWESDKEILDQIISKFDTKIEIDRNVDYRNTLAKTDLLVCDMSGIIFDFVFDYQKPAIAILKNSETKLMGYEDEDIEFRDSSYDFLETFGAWLPLQDIHNLKETIRQVSKRRIDTSLFDNFAFNLRTAGSVAANQIVDILKSL